MSDNTIGSDFSVSETACDVAQVDIEARKALHKLNKLSILIFRVYFCVPAR